MAGEDKVKVPHADTEVRKEMLDRTEEVPYGSFDVKNASGVSMTPEEIATEIARCKKTKRYN